jgi:hypothetical protein
MSVLRLIECWRHVPRPRAVGVASSGNHGARITPVSASGLRSAATGLAISAS